VTSTSQLPADGVAMMPIRLQLADADGQPVDANGSRASRSRLCQPAALQLKNSRAVVYYQLQPTPVGCVSSLQQTITAIP
jgi:hypothetical protein